jgi:hypothetical protein
MEVFLREESIARSLEIFFIFSKFSLGEPRGKKSNFQKKFPNHMKFCFFVYSGVFRHGELESEGIF